jgi:8-oxo-dGTP pyrophosphatase MutT (NUDIX family)
MSLTQPIDPDELTALQRRFGPVPVQHEALSVSAPFLTENRQRLLKDGRRAEICYIMHRGEPDQGVLLHRKLFYPRAAFRLPTGGVEPGEAVWDTLLREIYEETGMAVVGSGLGPDVVAVERFLGVVAYDFHHRQLNRHFSFATYHFLVRAPAQAEPDPIDKTEEVDAWLWQPASHLATLTDTLAHLDAETPEWADWGRFRALSHRFVAARLG